MRRVAQRHGVLGGFGQCEECREDGYEVGDDVLGDAVVGYVEEAGCGEGLVEGGEELGFGG